MSSLVKELKARPAASLSKGTGAKRLDAVFVPLRRNGRRPTDEVLSKSTAAPEVICKRAAPDWTALKPAPPSKTRKARCELSPRPAYWSMPPVNSSWEGAEPAPRRPTPPAEAREETSAMPPDNVVAPVYRLLPAKTTVPGPDTWTVPVPPMALPI